MSLVVHKLVLSPAGATTAQPSASHHVNVSAYSHSHTNVPEGVGRSMEGIAGSSMNSPASSAASFSSLGVPTSSSVSSSSSSSSSLLSTSSHSLRHTSSYNLPFVLQDHNYGAPPPPTPPQSPPPPVTTSQHQYHHHHHHHTSHSSSLSSHQSTEQHNLAPRHYIQQNRQNSSSSQGVLLGSQRSIPAVPSSAAVQLQQQQHQQQPAPQHFQAASQSRVSTSTTSLKSSSSSSSSATTVTSLPNSSFHTVSSPSSVSTQPSCSSASVSSSMSTLPPNHPLSSMPPHRQQFMPHPKTSIFPSPHIPPPPTLDVPAFPSTPCSSSMGGGGAETDDDSRFSDHSSSVGPSGEETETAPEGEGDDQPLDDSITRCVCDFTHDDGYMIQCDHCFVWQHVDCMEIDRNNIPEEYLCEACKPRHVNKLKARALQIRRRQEIQASLASRHSSSDSDDNLPVGSKGKCYSGKLPERKMLKKKKVKVLKDAKNGRKTQFPRKIGTVENNNIISSREDKEKRLPIKTRRRKSSSVSADGGDDSCSGTHVERLRAWVEGYESAVTNHYSPELRARVHSARINGISADLRASTQSIMSHGQRCRTLTNPSPLFDEFDKKVVVAVERMVANTAVIEYRGKYLLASQFQAQQPLLAQKFMPFMLYYRMPKERLTVCVDARTYGNDARFIRRSCTPNAEIRHLLERGSLHLYVVTTKKVEQDEEITLPLDTANSTQDLLCSLDEDHECELGPVKRGPGVSLSPVTGLFRKNGLNPGRKKTKTLKRPRGKRLGSTEVQTDASTPEVVPPVVLAPVVPPPALSPTITTLPVVGVTTPVKQRRASGCVKSPAKNPGSSSDDSMVSKDVAVTTKESSASSSSSTSASWGTSSGSSATTPTTTTTTPSGQSAPTTPETPKPGDKQKMTREERKIAAYMKAFERMEKAEQRRQEMEKKKEEEREKEKEKKVKECEEEDEGEKADIGSSADEGVRNTPNTDRMKRRGKKGRGKGSPTKKSVRTEPQPVAELLVDESSNSASLGGLLSPSSTSVEGIALNFASPPLGLATGSFRFPKTKKALMNEWLNETVDPVYPGGAVGGVADLSTGVPTCYMRSPAPQLRRSTSCGQVAAPGPAPPVPPTGDAPGGGCSAKKRWLRLAISEEIETLPTINGICPSPNSRPDSPTGGDYITPLKKRRLARESMSSELSSTPPSTPIHSSSMDDDKIMEEMEAELAESHERQNDIDEDSKSEVEVAEDSKFCLIKEEVKREVEEEVENKLEGLCEGMEEKEVSKKVEVKKEPHEDEVKKETIKSEVKDESVEEVKKEPKEELFENIEELTPKLKIKEELKGPKTPEGSPPPDEVEEEPREENKPEEEGRGYSLPQGPRTPDYPRPVTPESEVDTPSVASFKGRAHTPELSLDSEQRGPRTPEQAEPSSPERVAGVTENYKQSSGRKSETAEGTVPSEKGLPPSSTRPSTSPPTCQGEMDLTSSTTSSPEKFQNSSETSESQPKSAPVKRKLSILEYRKRKSVSSETDGKGSETLPPPDPSSNMCCSVPLARGGAVVVSAQSHSSPRQDSSLATHPSPAAVSVCSSSNLSSLTLPSLTLDKIKLSCPESPVLDLKLPNATLSHFSDKDGYDEDDDDDDDDDIDDVDEIILRDGPKKGNNSKDVRWDDAPTLLERQREDLTARLRREFGLCIEEDDEKTGGRLGALGCGSSHTMSLEGTASSSSSSVATSSVLSTSSVLTLRSRKLLSSMLLSDCEEKEVEKEGKGREGEKDKAHRRHKEKNLPPPPPPPTAPPKNSLYHARDITVQVSNGSKLPLTSQQPPPTGHPTVTLRKGGIHAVNTPLPHQPPPPLPPSKSPCPIKLPIVNVVSHPGSTPVVPSNIPPPTKALPPPTSASAASRSSALGIGVTSFLSSPHTLPPPPSSSVCVPLIPAAPPPPPPLPPPPGSTSGATFVNPPAFPAGPYPVPPGPQCSAPNLTNFPCNVAPPPHTPLIPPPNMPLPPPLPPPPPSPLGTSSGAVPGTGHVSLIGSSGAGGGSYPSKGCSLPGSGGS